MPGFCVALAGSNSDVKANDRLPIIAETHEKCGKKRCAVKKHTLKRAARAAQRAQRDSQILFQTLYFKDRPLSDPRCVVDAVIFSLRDNGVLVYIPQYAIKGPVYLESKEKEVLL